LEALSYFCYSQNIFKNSFIALLVYICSFSDHISYFSCYLWLESAFLCYWSLHWVNSEWVFCIICFVLEVLGSVGQNGGHFLWQWVLRYIVLLPCYRDLVEFKLLLKNAESADGSHLSSCGMWRFHGGYLMDIYSLVFP
jgi:hypothetical protein